MKKKTMTNINDPNGLEAPINAPMATTEQMFTAAVVAIIIIALIHFSRAGSGITREASGMANSVTASMSVEDIASLIR